MLVTILTVIMILLPTDVLFLDFQVGLLVIPEALNANSRLAFGKLHNWERP